MEKTHKKNIFIKGSKYPLPPLDEINLEDGNFLIIDLDHYNYSNLSLFVELSPPESASYCLDSKREKIFHYDYSYKKSPSLFDGLSYSGLIKTNNPQSFIFDRLSLFPLPKKSGDKKIIFLDRDGVLNINTGYPHIPDELIINQEIIPALKKAQEKGYEFIVITNQSGIARGLFLEQDYQKCTEYLSSYFHNHGISILDWFHCPYHKDGIIDEFTHLSIDRKPLPGMILKATEKHLIDLKSSIMIGDNESDNVLLPYLDFKLVGPGNYYVFI